MKKEANETHGSDSMSTTGLHRADKLSAKPMDDFTKLLIEQYPVYRAEMAKRAKKVPRSWWHPED